MYKLNIISGPNRGTSFGVSDGEISIGRQAGNTVVLSSAKVSKRHCTLQIIGSTIVLKDNGSSNGTFVNGILVKEKSIRIGDRISVGEFVLELSRPLSPSSSIVPASSGLGLPRQPVIQQPKMDFSDDGGYDANLPPRDLKGKLVWYFENGIMPIFYNLNFKYEWNVICIGMFSVFLFGNLFLSVYPLLESNRESILKETRKRARLIARQIAEQNVGHLAARNETKAEIGTLENAEGVRLAVIIDMDNRVIAPSAKLNQYLAVGGESVIAVRARNRFREGIETGFAMDMDQDTVIAIEPIKVLSPNLGKNVVVAMALVSIDSSLSTPDVGEMGTVYSQVLILTGLLGGIVLLILYRLTLKPFNILNEDLDRALKGELSQVTHEFRIQELDSLWDIINSAIQRIPSGGSSSLGSGDSNVQDTQVMEEFLVLFRMLGEVVPVGLVVFDSEKRIVHLNAVFEELSGIRLDSARGQGMSDVARDQALGVFTSDLLDRTSVGSDGLSEEFEFSGVSYRFHSAAVGSMGGLTKGYLLAIVKMSEG